MHASWKSAARLVVYARRYKLLLLSTLAMGMVGFAIIFLFPWLIGTVIDEVIGSASSNGGDSAERAHWLVLLLIVGGITVPVSSVASYGRGHLSVKLGNRIIADLRQDLFDHLNRLSLQFYSKERTGSIVSRLINDIQQASQIISGGGILLLLDLVQMFAGLALLLLLSWKIALASLVVMPLYAMTFRRYNPRVREASERVQSQISKISGSVQERLAGIALVKASGMEENESQQFRVANEEYYGRVVAQSSLSHLAAAISEGLIHTGTLILIGLGGYLAIWGHPPMTAGKIVTLLGWLGVMYGPVRHISEINIVYQTSMAALDRVFRVFSVTPAIVEKPRSISRSPLNGEVVFEAVKFRYEDDLPQSRVTLEELTDRDCRPGSDCTKNECAQREISAKRWVLDGLQFKVSPGERVALVGPSGSGKSTLASLLPRLYDVCEGRILIDSVDVRDYRLRSLRQSIGVVQQRSLVFSGTIRDNLCYGCATMTDTKIVEAARAAHAHEFIARLPQGYDAPLGESGVTLSGGQLQRLSIARALLRDPRILILDEATSALDSENEALVQQALERVMKGRTCFIIAHRFSTIRSADRILVLDEGKIVESGSNDELIALNGVYARLARQQFGVRSSQSPQPPSSAAAIL
jgi:subfamily B ATP-binding cassette protein MsbA